GRGVGGAWCARLLRQGLGCAAGVGRATALRGRDHGADLLCAPTRHRGAPLPGLRRPRGAPDASPHRDRALVLASRALGERPFTSARGLSRVRRAMRVVETPEDTLLYSRA